MKKKLSCLFLVFSLLFASIATNNVFAESEEVLTSISDATITWSPSEITTAHAPKDITVTVTDSDGNELVESADYEVSWFDNGQEIDNSTKFTLAGNASVTISGIGTYTDSKTQNFTVMPIDISEAAITLSLQDGTVLPYNEETQVVSNITTNFTPSGINVTVTYSGQPLTLDSDYTLGWWKRTAGGGWIPIGNNDNFTLNDNCKLDIANCSNTSDFKTITFTVTQGNNIAVESISLSNTFMSTSVGNDYSISATIVPENASNQSITWTSGDTSIATVEKLENAPTVATISAIKEGTTTITATSDYDDTIYATCEVTVSSLIPDLPLKRTSATMYVGETLDLTTSGEPSAKVSLEEGALPTNGITVEWKSADEDIATVDSDGIVTAHKEGKVIITVTATVDDVPSDTKSATCQIEVIKKASLEPAIPVEPTTSAIKLDQTEITLSIGAWSVINVTVEPEDAVQNLSVEAKDSDIVRTEIMQDNIIGVFGLAEGTTEIAVISNDKNAICKVTVKKPTITALNPTYNKDLWDRDDNESRKHRIIALIDTPFSTELISNIKIKDTGSFIPVEPLSPGDIQDSEWLFENASWLKENLDIDVTKVTPICLKNGIVEKQLGLGTYNLEIELMGDETTTVTTTLTIVGSKTDYDDLTWVKGSSEGLTIATIPNLTADLLKKKFTFEDLSLTKDFINNYHEIDDDIFDIDANGNIIIKKELLNILARDLEEDAYFNIEATLRENGPDMDENTRDIKLDVNFKILLTAPSTGNGDTGTGDTGTGSGGSGYYDNVTTNFTDDATCTHEWTDATCTTPKTCSKCGETEGQALGHNYKEEVIAPTNSFLGATFCTCSNTGCNSSYYKDYTLLAGSHPTYLPDGRTISGNVTSTSTTVNRNGTNLNIILEDPLGVITKSGDTFTLEATQLADTSSLDSTHVIEYIHAYEINPVVNGNKISGQLSNKIRMLYEIPSDWDKADLQVVLMQSGSDVEFDEKTEILNGKEYLVVWTDHFSPYGFIDTLSADDKAQGQTGVTFVKTGESNVCLITTLLLSTISAGLFLEICLRKKFKKQ